MDMMEVRRRVMLSMAGGLKPFKTIILEENHTNDTIGNSEYWYDVFKEYIDADSILICVFTNNDSTGNPNYSYFVNLITYANEAGGGILTWNVRNKYYNQGTGISNQRSLWALQGTVIKLYRIPKN